MSVITTTTPNFTITDQISTNSVTTIAPKGSTRPNINNDSHTKKYRGDITDNTEIYNESTTVAYNPINNTNELNLSNINYKTTKNVISTESSTKRVWNTSLLDSIAVTTPIPTKKSSTRIDTSFEQWHNITAINTEVYATSTSVPIAKGDWYF